MRRDPRRVLARPYDLSLGRPLAADLAAHGYTAWNLEYRRVGGGGGRPATFANVSAGIHLLAALDVDTSAVVAIGHSAGGHLAAWAAGRAQPRVAITGVVSQAGVLDLVRCANEGTGGTAAVDLMGGAPAQLPDDTAGPTRCRPSRCRCRCCACTPAPTRTCRRAERRLRRGRAAGRRTCGTARDRGRPLHRRRSVEHGVAAGRGRTPPNSRPLNRFPGSCVAGTSPIVRWRLRRMLREN